MCVLLFTKNSPVSIMSLSDGIDFIASIFASVFIELKKKVRNRVKVLLILYFKMGHLKGKKMDMVEKNQQQQQRFQLEIWESSMSSTDAFLQDI